MTEGSIQQDVIRTERLQGVGIITVCSPPVNALSHLVRVALHASIEDLDGDDSLRAIVICGAGAHFIAGADVREFDQPPLPPLLNDVLLRLEACRKPVIAALQGSTLGGGAEVALASHYRCATGSLRYGFPEVKLGLIPGSGGTVRLPRLVGVQEALTMMVDGSPIDLARARELGIVDRTITGDLRDGAISWARELIAAAASSRRIRDLPRPIATAEVFEQFRASLRGAQRDSQAIESIIASLQAVVKQDFDPALAEARRHFEACRVSTASRALRHLFFAERSAGKCGTTSRSLDAIGIVGAGTMGAGIATAFLQSGFDVVLYDSQSAALAAGSARVRANIEGAVRRGKMTEEGARQCLPRLTCASDIAGLGGSDVVIEAAFENLDVKRELFEKFNHVCKATALLATNTSTLDIDAIAAASDRPADVIGLHFFSPAHIMRLVEIVRGTQSSADALAAGAALTRRLGKTGVVSGNRFGFIGNRMLYAYGREKEVLLLEGVSVPRLDTALEQFGMAMGPNAVGDLAGLDVGASARRQWRDRPEDPCFYRVTDLLVERGWYGQKSGRGFYRYDAQNRRTPDPEVEAAIRAEAAKLGVSQRTIDDAEIVERCMLALINEGARVLEEGIALNASDIDVVWCNGYGFPRTRGGPMFYADTLGCVNVVRRLEYYAGQRGKQGRPADILLDLARNSASLVT